MQKLRYSGLSRFKGNIDVLRIRSFDCQMYIPEFDAGGVTYRVTDERDGAVHFRSQLAAKKPFKGLGIRLTKLVHESSFDEMIGIAGEGANRFEVSIQNPDDDYS